MPAQHEPNSQPAMNENPSGPCPTCGADECCGHAPAVHLVTDEGILGSIPELKPCPKCKVAPRLIYLPGYPAVAICCPNQHFRSILCSFPEVAARAWNDGELVFINSKIGAYKCFDHAQHEPNSQPAMKKLISCAALALCLSGCSPNTEQITRMSDQCSKTGGSFSYQMDCSFFSCDFKAQCQKK